MTEPKTPLDQALDVFLYLPVGLAMTARDELPRVIEKGRQRVTNEVTMARAVGQFAVTMGQKEVEKAVRAATNRFTSPPPSAATPAAPTTPSGTGAAAGASDTSAPSPASAQPVASTNGSSPRAETNGRAAPPVANLAIPGYDTLSASQVVQRLAGLAPGELEAVREYESATRQRRTILTKVAQLQDGAGG